ncbi:MAG: hypothetical protein OEZ65_09925 [Gemmatimonadota bacterium]|nr:hypothetical protein [Gemmatimonadota bacterium]MDH5759895.1 hypothetical protein [Gemmatimonadota bacterium]
MDWTLIGALGELLGAVAVVVSLVYLSRQVHQNTSAVQTANAVTVQGNFQQLARMFYTDREMGDLVLRAMRGDPDMMPADRIATYAYFFDFMKTAELAYYQFLNGDLDRQLWEATFEFYHAYFTTPGFRAYWAERRSAFIPIFQVAMDGWLAGESKIKRPDVLVGATPMAGGAS